MGELIDLSAYRENRRALTLRKQSDSIAVTIELVGKKTLPRLRLPPLGEVFVKNFPLQITDPYALDSFILELLADPKLPKLNLESSYTVLNTDKKLQALGANGVVPFMSALSYARLYLERSGNFSMHELAAVRELSKPDRIARAILGMYSIAWQLDPGRVDKTPVI